MPFENAAAEIMRKFSEFQGMDKKKLKVIAKVLASAQAQSKEKGTNGRSLTGRKKKTSDKGSRAVASRGEDSGLRIYRTKRTMTQGQLAEATGISQSYISAMETGKLPMGQANAMKLGQVLKVDYRKLY